MTPCRFRSFDRALTFGEWLELLPDETVVIIRLGTYNISLRWWSTQNEKKLRCGEGYHQRTLGCAAVPNTGLPEL